MPYIEREEPGSYFNPTSSTVKVNPSYGNTCELSCDCDSIKHPTDEEINIKRWNDLLQDWDNYTFEQKMAFFCPMVCYIHTRDKKYGNETNTAINEKISRIAFTSCRKIDNLKFDVDRIGEPNVMITLKPIDTDSIPDSDIRFKVKSWGFNYVDKSIGNNY